MKTLALIFLISCSLLTGSYAQSKEQTAVNQAVDQLKTLMITPDKVKLEALTADELSYGHSSGKIEDKAAFIEALVSGSSDFVSMALTDQSVIIVDNTALVRHKLTGETLDNGQPGQVKLAVLQVWIKQRGNWKLVGRQAVKI